MPEQNKFHGVKIAFHIVDENKIDVELELDSDHTEHLPQNLVNLLAFIRGQEGLAQTVKIYKDACKSMKRKDLYRDFTTLLKTLALEKMTVKESPMISSMEVLGRKRMS